jgi:hypothetical protein
MDAVGQWLSRLCNLNVARTRARGRAPHKPILLLCLVDMIDERVLTAPWVAYSPQLFFRFQSYWDIVRARQQNRPNLRMPFHALGSERDRVWVGAQCARVKVTIPVPITNTALKMGARLVTAEKRPVLARCDTPATTISPIPTSVIARPRLKQRTAMTPMAA